MDFFQIGMREIERGPKKGEFEIFADFTVGRSSDLMVRGGSFYAIWDEEKGLWSTDEYDVQRLVDAELYEYANKNGGIVKPLKSFGSNSWAEFRRFMHHISDNSHQLDEKLTFANTEVKKSDYVSRRLPYHLAPGDYSAWDELIGTLYSVEERAKIEWAIGAIVSGDSVKIQKFLVLYGPPASGKSTILNIILKLFEGYTTTFDARALGSSSGSFATEVFRYNPLVAIQQDGDLSKIEDNTRLNSIIAHEDMTMNEKYKASYTARVNAFLFMGTNQPVKISDAKSGIIRRLIDVTPTGVRIPANHYNTLLAKIDFELGAIAYHCLQVYLSMGKNYYNHYRPVEMMFQTDIFFNFIEAYYDIFKDQGGTSLKQAYMMYKEYCGETGIDRPLPQYKVREELRNYFDEFHERYRVDDEIVRSYYTGFNANRFKELPPKETVFSLVLEETESLLDEVLADMPAQSYVLDESGNEIPMKRWENVTKTLKDFDTTKIHFVKLPTNHIVIDFDIKDKDGNKSLERNLEAASAWPPTYAELSKGGAGVHLHYYYPGDVYELASVFSEGIEIKTLLGGAALRRRLTKCNAVPISTFTGSLPVKEKDMLAPTQIKSEKGLRNLIEKNLRKEVHGATKPSIDFIHKILEDAYASGMEYDVSDMRGRLIIFANNSTNQPLTSLKMVQKMKFQSEQPVIQIEEAADDRLVFFDVEVYPNLFVVCWKYQDDTTVTKMINPTPQEIEQLFAFKLVGFNNRRYDNHILYGRVLGYDNEALYKLSQEIISGNNKVMFASAYGVSYADIYEFSSKKQSLKKWEIELGLHHMELDLPWDKPVQDKDLPRVIDYCVNDVNATESVFNNRAADFTARKILAELSGLAINDTTQRHAAKIIFEGDRRAHEQFVYTDLSKKFPGYKFDMGKSSYRGENPSEGGYVYAEPGYYENVAVLDVASMHPTSIRELNLFGEYTDNFTDLLDVRVAIKRKDFKSARNMLNGRLKPYLTDEENAKDLSDALKIVINIVYGLTSAKFENPFRDVRNKDNIVAKRGALFMIDLKHAVQEQGYTVAHIKTDSIKIPNADRDVINFITEFGKKYGYDFEHEKTYDKFCLVNEAVYIAKEGDHWEAVGAQFQHPYVYKTLFSKEEVVYADLCEAKQVQQGSIYIDFENSPKEYFDVTKAKFVGRTGLFVPVIPEFEGGTLYRYKDGSIFSIAGTKGYRWVEAEILAGMDEEEYIQIIDSTYFESLATDAVKTIEKYVPFEEFVKG